MYPVISVSSCLIRLTAMETIQKYQSRRESIWLFVWLLGLCMLGLADLRNQNTAKMPYYSPTVFCYCVFYSNTTNWKKRIKKHLISATFWASNQANWSVLSFKHTPYLTVHIASNMHPFTPPTGCSENQEAVFFGAVCSAIILISTFPLACLLWCRSSGGFPRRPDCPRGCPRRSDDNWAAFAVNRVPPGR